MELEHRQVLVLPLFQEEKPPNIDLYGSYFTINSNGDDMRFALALDPKVKNVLKGAAVQVAAKSASHLGFLIARNQGVTDATLRANPWYSFPVKGLNIPTDDFVTCLGIPAGLFVASKVIKKENRKEMLKQMAVGAGISGLAVLLWEVLIDQGPKYIPPKPSAGLTSFGAYTPTNNSYPRSYQNSGSGSKYTIVA